MYTTQPCRHGEHDQFLYYLLHAYKNYQTLLAQTNRIDFAHLQKCAYDLLQKEQVHKHITHDLRYILVDEYQDTNYIQEQILLSLARATGKNNLFVVGDEDQALYRFRGATVRNILEFARKREFEGHNLYSRIRTKKGKHGQTFP
ncbi:hypothetical protein KSX_80220 [Ktedonospora formicarum]|uniref:UvrD-like helicase ATP-binding domain-containing protein n=1 Tax=Ktedonospora formicarum TaxID=2778364 RepID=A0A8J3I5D9_9CHLR|nr:hypothetical protein KSX_80220 [Ktedonospora formicarum]